MNDYLPKPFTPDDLYRKIFEDLKIKPTKKVRPAETPVSREKAAYDFTYLRSLSENNEEFIREMIQTFIQTIPPVLSDMNTSILDENWERLSKLAHQIKPSLALMGMNELRTQVLFIEENGKAKTNLNELQKVTREFIIKCEDLIQELSKQLLPAQ